MKSRAEQVRDSCGDRWGQPEKPSGDSWGCVGTTHPNGTGHESLLQALGYHHPAWMKDALCRETPSVNFFPGKGQPTGPALAVCGNCLCREACLAWALADPDLDHGVLGGQTARARSNARRLQQRRQLDGRGVAPLASTAGSGDGL